MERTTIAVGAYEVNCSIVRANGRVLVIDPGAEGDRVADALEKLGLAPDAILLTHAHFDHIGGVAALESRFPDIQTYLGLDDAVMFGHPFNQAPPDYPLAPKPQNLRDAHALEGVVAIDTPGHTPGGISYYFPDDGILFSGDTLFAGSVGRTDFPGGSMSRLMDSLKKLTALPPKTVVVPGHGPETTIAEEIRSNPFLA